MDVNKLTQKSQEALSEAQRLSAQYGHQEVDVEHLALALTIQENGFVPRVLEQAKVHVKVVISALEEVLKKRPSVRGPGSEMGKITISQRLSKVIANAELLAKRLGDEYVSVEHLFAECLNEPESTGMGQVAKEIHLTSQRFIEVMLAVRGPHRVTSPTPEDSYEALKKYGKSKVSELTLGEALKILDKKDITPQYLTKVLNEYSKTILLDNKISFTTSRTSIARLVTLKKDIDELTE